MISNANCQNSLSLTHTQWLYHVMHHVMVYMLLHMATSLHKCCVFAQHYIHPWFLKMYSQI